MNRRRFLQTASAVPLLGRPVLPAQRSYSEELPDMLLQFLAKKTNALAEKWDRERERIHTAADIEARNRFVREKVREMMHGLPERTPLGAVTVRTQQRDGYRVENVMFQSRPNFWVTGNLYVPSSGTGPFPGIISPCGHSAEARIYPSYQFTYMGLVRQGFVVLAYDPIGQGERRQYWNSQTRQNEIGGPVTWEHDLPGQLLMLLGEDLAQYRVWDGMRAIDYLLERPEVDGKRIGCTGQSGGGTLTLFISSIDERVRCAAAHEGGGRHRWPLVIRPETQVSTGDIEQHFFPAAIYGIDMCDLYTAIAPRPLLVTIENYSPGFDRLAADLRARYQQIGAPASFATEQATDPHGMTAKLRIATTDWFCRWFYNRRGPDREPDFELEPAENLYCTPNGSIREARQGDTIFSLILKKQAALPPERRTPAGAAGLDAYRREISGEMKELLRYKKYDGPLAVREIVTTARKGYKIEKLEFLSEPGIYIPVWVFLPEGAQRRQEITLWVDERGKQADGLELGALDKMARGGRIVAAIDVRGIGETRPPHPGENVPGTYRFLDDVETVMAIMAWEIDESLFGMRVQDVVRAVDYALSRSDAEPGGVRVAGKGMGALWALYAAALDPRIRSVVAEGGLLTYRTLTSGDRYLHGIDIFLPGVLKHFDLPQVAAAVAPRPLVLRSPVDAMRSPVPAGRIRRAYDFTLRAYAAAGQPEGFRIEA